VAGFFACVAGAALCFFVFTALKIIRENKTSNVLLKWWGKNRDTSTGLSGGRKKPQKCGAGRDAKHKGSPEWVDGMER